MDAFMASIQLFAGNFAPKSWAMCQGQVIAISTNSALFALLGTSFGGNGVSTFALPNLASRVPVGTGQGPGLSSYVLGEQGGVEHLTLLQSNMPPHTHIATATVTVATAINCCTGAGVTLSPTPAGNIPTTGHDTGTGALLNMYGTPGTGNAATMASNMASNTVNASVVNGVAGSGIPIQILPPYLGMNYIICQYGIFPTRN
jgi:microcystin-dependent protein